VIELNPPLPFVAGVRTGFVTQISATTARVKWSDQTQQTHPDSILIMTGDLKPHDLAISSAQQDLLTFCEAAQPAAMDLLHVVRKGQHIAICAQEDVEHTARSHGFDTISLPVVALPEKSWEDVSTDVNFCNKTFAAPILITGMTGGVARAAIINERLAHAAVKHNVPMGVGSQRMALENPAYNSIFKLKDRFPTLFLIGNLGIGQLRHASYLDDCQRAVDMISADAMAIHVNVLQELIQVEGDRDFRGLIERIGNIAEALKVPVIVKEVGAGLDSMTAKKLWDVGIRHFDIGGSGGTSWAHIEGLRSSDAMIKRRGAIFRDWGIPTATALTQVRAALPKASLIATGGIRDGLTALKATVVGANMVGIGLPLMRAALDHVDGPEQLLGSIITEYKIAKFCSGL
jgi:isopentenyl-diphosphate delta-isomerase